MRQGRHVPADVIVQLLVEKMMTQSSAVGYLVVGFPRVKRQVILLLFHAASDIDVHAISRRLRLSACFLLKKTRVGA